MLLVLNMLHFILQSYRNSQFDWLIRSPYKALLDREKAYWTMNSVAIEPLQMLKNIVPEILTENFVCTLLIKSTNNFLKICLEFAKIFPKIFSFERFGFTGMSKNFPRTFDSIPEIFPRVCFGYTMMLLFISVGLYFKTTVRIFCHMNLIAS